jgi:DNA-binding PadR family transcriptional regulator
MARLARGLPEDTFDEAETVFEAVASPVRLHILKTLEADSAKYNELMRQIGLDQFKDAGRFAYHLRKLLQSGLVDIESNTKKYRLTDLGARVLDYYRNIGDFLTKKTRRLEVRKSNLAMEPFDRTKIENYLIKEASLRADLAAQIATEVEERLLSIPVRYLTAPLIREFVNAVLIERGLEDYRHKLTRLGLPVYDVTSFFDRSGEICENVKRQAGDAALLQYLLLNALPREVADAHLSGTIHLNHAPDWCLRPEDVVHDAGLLLRGKKIPSGWGVAPIALEFSGGIKDALRLLSLGLEKATSEVSCGQTLDCFNFMVAKWAGDCERSALENYIREFLFDLISRGKPVGMTLDLGSNPPLPELREFSEEAQSMAEMVISQLLSLSSSSLLGNLRLMVRIGSADAFAEDSPLMLAHRLALAQGNVVFTRNFNNEGSAIYTWNCGRIAPNNGGEYVADVSRSGIVGSAAINLPRIAHTTTGNERRLFEALDKVLRLASKALEVKRDWVAGNMAKGLLPMLSHHTPAESYFSNNKGIYLIELVGIEEASTAFLGEGASAEGSFSVMRKILEHVPAQLTHRTERTSLRLAPSAGRHEYAARRMAEMDAERYGWNEINRGQERQYRTLQATGPSLPLESRLRIEAEFQKRLSGGHTLVMTPDMLEGKGHEQAFRLTQSALRDYGIQSLTYSISRSMCLYCGSIMGSEVVRCEHCGSTTRLYVPEIEQESPQPMHMNG